MLLVFSAVQETFALFLMYSSISLQRYLAVSVGRREEQD